MLSLSPCVTANTLNLKSNELFLIPPSSTHRRHFSRPISAIINPSSFSKAQPQQKQHVYQPFRPPTTPIPSQFGTLDIPGRIDILANRLGLWYEYAPLIPSLIRDGFSPPSIEEATGISGVEQNRLIVAAQVRDSLVQSAAHPDLLAAFETSGAELLYEIRLLSTSQRVAAARFLVENRCDGKAAQELARAMKDFPSRRGEKGWESFDYTLPGDCLSFMYYRQSREHRNPSEQRNAALEQALRVAETEPARREVLEELKGKDGEEGDEAGDGETAARVPVVRLKIGEVAEASSVVVLPVCEAEERQVLEAPFECRSEGEFGVVVAEKAWGRWVVLPGWEPVLGLGKGGVVVSFVDARALPWKANKWYKEEPILVVVDRSNTDLGADDGFYVVNVEGGGLKVERGLALKELGFTQTLGSVLLVVRPPKEEDDDQLSDQDWD
ncbi:Rubisco accumulation factor 1.2, chloroplastic, partial [Mucuna pruriens]